MRLRHLRRIDLPLARRAARVLLAALALSGSICRPASAAAISFLPPVTYDVPGGGGIPLAVDLDGDGKLDLVATSVQGLYLFYGKGDGTFEPPVVLPMVVGWTITADVNGDGRPDLIATAPGGDAIVVIINQGARQFAAPVAYPVGSGASGIAAGDFNGDGKVDLAVANINSHNMCVLLNHGDGTFAPAVFYPSGSGARIILTADLNRDGNLDLVMGQDYSFIVYLGDGKGGFAASGNYPTGGGYPGMTLIDDFNRDGIPDVATANTFSNDVSVFLGDGHGGFLPPKLYGTIQYPHVFASADLDGDGAPDIVVPHNGTSAFSVLQNKGDGTFLPAVTFGSGGSNTRLLGVGDFNGDGRPDVVTSNESSNNIAVLINSTPRSTSAGPGPAPGPWVRLSPNTPDFGPVFPGRSSAAQSVTVRNSGSAPLILGSVTLSGANPGDFSVTPSATTIAPGDTATLSIVFSPTAAGPRSALLTITDNAADGSFTLSLTGTALALGSSGTVTLPAIDSKEMVEGPSPIGYYIWPNLNIDTPDIGPSYWVDTVSGLLNAMQVDGLVKFDVSAIPAGAVITGATLRTYASSVWRPAAVVVYHAGSENWSRPATDPYPGRAELLTPMPDNSFVPVVSWPGGLGLDWNLNVGALDWSSVLSQKTFSLLLRDLYLGGRLNQWGSGTGSPPVLTISYVVPTSQPAAPTLSADATFVAFDDQLAGSTSAARTITITNTGSLPLTIGSIALKPALVIPFDRYPMTHTDSAFAIASDTGEPVLAPGASRKVTITFSPTDPSLYWATLAIEHNDPRPEALHVVTLTGTGTVSALDLGATSVTFSNQQVGTTSDAQTVNINNTAANTSTGTHIVLYGHHTTGTGPLIIQSVRLDGANAGDFRTADVAGTTIAPGGSGTISVKFAPTARGSRTATLVITDNVPGSPHQVALSGTGIGPVMRLVPTELDFGPQPMGLSGSLALLLQNTGDAPLTVSGITFQGPNTADFRLAPGGWTGGTLQPGEMSLLNVRFSPAATGTRSASLIITDDAAGSPQLISLTGTGTAPLLVLSATGLLFSLIPAGDGSPTQTLTLTNNGDAPLNIDGFALSGPNAGSFHLVSDSGQKILAPGDSRIVKVSFSPAAIASVRSVARIAAARIAAVSYSAILEIKHNDPHPGTPHQITLTAVDTRVATPTPPAAPTGLTATLTANNQVALAWIDNSSNEKAFAIWRQTGGGDFVRVGVIVPNSTSFTDAGVSPRTTYTYRVRATNDLASPWSNLATITTLEAPPAAPSGLTTKVVSAGEIDLAWKTGGGDETGISIFRQTNGGAWQRIGVVSPRATGYVDRGVTPGTKYNYRVRAHNDHYASAWTNEAGASIPAPPAAPTKLVATVVSAGEIDLGWTSGKGNETGISIFRQINGGAWEWIGVVAPSVTRYADRSVKAGTSYGYRARAHNDYLASAWTNTASGHTPAGP